MPDETLSPTAAAPPKVSAIMLTGHVPEREPFSRAALHAYLNQSYRNRELLILNQGDYTLNTDKHPDVRELHVDKQTVGALYNFGRREASGDWHLLWSDDDYHHPHRMAMQMAHRDENSVCVLGHSLLVDLTSNTVSVISDAAGFSGTMLLPAKLPDQFHEEPFDGEAATMPDALFHRKMATAGRSVRYDNHPAQWPGAGLYVRLWHTTNATGETNRVNLLARGDASWIRDDHVAMLNDIFRNDPENPANSGPYQGMVAFNARRK